MAADTGIANGLRWWEGLSGPLLGRYRIEGLVGHGGMAEVLLAADERFPGRRVAIKAPNLDNFAPDQAAELLLRFKREVSRQGGEPISGMVPIIDAGEITDSRGNSQPFLVMDFLSGGSLGNALGGGSGRRERTQTLAEVLAWLRPIAATLDRLHARRYLHRDVKPDNILFNADGDPFLSDFGIATSLDDVAGAGTMMSVLGAAGPGSPGYQAPESLRGDKLAASDQFSLAVTAYEALAGRLPMHAGTRDAWIGALANWQPTPLSELRPELPAQPAAVLMRALSGEPHQRFISCTAFAQALAEAVAAPASVTPLPAAPTATPPPSPTLPESAAPRFRARLASVLAFVRRWGWKAAILLIALAAAAILIGKSRNNSHEPPVRESVPLPLPAEGTGASGEVRSLGAQGDAARLTEAALATRQLDHDFQVALAQAQVDTDNLFVKRELTRAAVQSSLVAAAKGKQAADSALRLARLARSYADLYQDRGRSLVSYALDVSQRANNFAQEPPYTRAQREFGGFFPGDERKVSVIAGQVDSILKAIRAEATVPAGGVDADGGSRASAEFKARMGNFTDRFTQVQSVGNLPEERAERCRALRRVALLGAPAEGQIASEETTQCANSARVFNELARLAPMRARDGSLMVVEAELVAKSCEMAGAICPDFGFDMPMRPKGRIELVTDNLLVVSFEDGLTEDQPPVHWVLTRSSEEAPASLAATFAAQPAKSREQEVAELRDSVL
jgi:serine/threonine protein kinase